MLPNGPRDTVPGAVRWAYAVQAVVQTVPARELMRPARISLIAVVWVLAAAADVDLRISAGRTAAVLAREAGVGDRVWQKRTAWLRERGWLRHGAGGQWDGWQLVAGTTTMSPTTQRAMGTMGEARS